MSTRARATLWVWAVGAALGFAGAAHAQTSILENFESGEGRFDRAPSFSGTTAGETETSPGVGPSTADRSTAEAYEGSGSQRIFMDDDPASDAPGTLAWRLRHLAGGGSPGTTNPAFASTGYIGYYLKTTTPNLRAGIFIDDGAALELSTKTPVIADGQWHRYQWQFSDANQWDAFAGTGPNGQIDSASVSIDGLYIDAVKDPTIADQDAVFFIDAVALNPTGEINVAGNPAVPEPAAVGLLAPLAGALIARRRR